MKRKTVDHPLRRFRERYDLSIQSIANAVGVTKPTISRIETGHIRCTPEMAIKIEGATMGHVRRDHLRPDLWAHPKVREDQGHP
jgi:DNA-binding transcriptional regulator YdaS (Cro superfamily)